jgi:hypothetical protein
LTKPSLQKKVENRQAASKFQRDSDTPVMRRFDLFQPVKVRNMRGGKEKWISGTVVAVKGPYTYLVRVPGNNRRFVHVDHMVPHESFEQIPGIQPEVESEPPQIREYSKVSERSVDVPIVPQLPQVSIVPDTAESPDTVESGPVKTPSVELPKSGMNEPIVTNDMPSQNSTPIRKTKSGRIVRTPKRIDM